MRDDTLLCSSHSKRGDLANRRRLEATVADRGSAALCCDWVRGAGGLMAGSETDLRAARWAPRFVREPLPRASVGIRLGPAPTPPNPSTNFLCNVLLQSGDIVGSGGL